LRVKHTHTYFTLLRERERDDTQRNNIGIIDF